MKEHQSKHALAIAIRTALWGGSICLIHGSVFAAPNPSDGQEQNSTQLPTITVSANNTNSLTTEGSGLYTAKATTASTGLALSLKETPQSVSVMTQQRMQDQNLTQLTDVANQVAGLTVSQSGNVGSDSSPIYSRGKSVDSYLLDGVKLLSTYSSIFKAKTLHFSIELKWYEVRQV